jgi:hypothetical protein
VPKSRVRRKSAYTPQTTAEKPVGRLPSRWVPILMVTFFLVGLAWIVTYYIAGQDIAFMAKIGNWNLVLGFGLLLVGFGFATRWR